ncbi:microtubule-associated protein tau isoform X5 [Aedes aegypti]|uniref:Microtubule-associated protein n=1 Tax=Aedes aegypti TaxID=7159 RepID=A0A6I8TLC1_AEDAE|nr:microtubule-associated protein tau isoform X5 [Aedes aegypti]
MLQFNDNAKAQNPPIVLSKPDLGENPTGSPASTHFVPPKPPPQPPLQPQPLIRQLYTKPIIAPQLLDLHSKPPLSQGQGNQYPVQKTGTFPPHTASIYYQSGTRQIMSQNGPGTQRPPNPSMSPQNMRSMGPMMQRPGAPPLNRPPGPPGQYITSPNVRPQMPPPPQQQQQQQQPSMQRPPLRPTTPQQVRPTNVMPQNVRPPFSPQNSTTVTNQPIRSGAPLVRPPNIGQSQSPIGGPGTQQIRPTPIPQQIINNRPPSMPFRSPAQLGSFEQSGTERDSPETFNRMQSDLSLGKTDSPRSSYLSTDDDDDVVIGKITPLASSRSPEDLLSATSKISAPLNRSDSQISIPSRPQSGLGNYIKSSDRTAQSPQPLQSNEIVYKEKQPISAEKPLDGLSHPEKANDELSKNISHVLSNDNTNRPNKPLDFASSRQQSSTSVGKHRQSTPTTPGGTDRVTFVLPDETNGTENSEHLRKTPLPPNALKKPDVETRGRSPFKSNLSVDKDHPDKDNKGDNDSGVDESTQEKDRNGPNSPGSPLKSPTKIPSLRRPESITPQTRSRSTSKQRLTAKTPEFPTEPLIKKVPMNKIQVGAAPSPNLKVVRSKIGSLENATHKPGGGHVKIETKKLDIKAAPRIEAKNEAYVPKGGDKKIVTTKLTWNAKPKIGSLDNANHRPGGGDKKIETLKMDFKDRARPKIGSKDNLGYQPGGGDVKPGSAITVEQKRKAIVNQKLDIKAESKIGSLENIKHRPGGGDKKIFDDKDYLKQIDHPVALTPPSQSPVPDFDKNSYY